MAARSYSLLVVLAGLCCSWLKAADELPKYATPEECFKAFQAADKDEDWRARWNCCTTANANIQVGNMAFQVEQIQIFREADRKSATTLLEKHNLGDIDIMGALQIADSPNGGGVERALNRVGAKVDQKAEFAKAASALIKQAAKAAGKDAEAAENPTRISDLKLGKVSISGDTASGQLQNDQGENVRKVSFRRIEGSWLLSLPGKEPKAPPFTPEQEAALQKLDKKWQIRIGSEDEGFPLQWMRPIHLDAGDDDLAPIAALTTLKEVSLEGTQITDKGLVHLKNLKSLEVVDLSDTAATEDALRAFYDHANLQAIIMTNIDVSREAIAEFKKHVPRCRVIADWRVRGWRYTSFEGASAGWLKDGHAALVLVEKRPGNKAQEEQLSKLINHREVLQILREHQVACLAASLNEQLDGAEDDWLTELNSLKVTTAPALLIYAPGRKKPTILNSNTTTKEIVAALQAATAKKQK